MGKITVKELSERILKLEPNEQIQFYDDEEKNDPPIGVIRLDVLDSVVILINYIGGGCPCVIDITCYMEDVTNVEAELLNYISEERMLEGQQLCSDQIYVFIDNVPTAPVCEPKIIHQHKRVQETADNCTNEFRLIKGIAKSTETTADPANEVDTNNMLYSAATYGDFFKIYEKGITVELTFNGFAYTGYSQFFDDHPQYSDLKPRFAYGQPLPVKTPLSVLGWGVHCHEATVVYVLENPGTGLIYLCGADCAGYIKILSHKAKYATREEAK